MEDKDILINYSDHFRPTTSLFSTLNAGICLEGYDTEYKKYLYKLWKPFQSPLRKQESMEMMLTLFAAEGINENSSALREALKQGVNRRVISYLTDTDLKLLGISDVKVRQSLLRDFKNLPVLEIPYISVLQYGNNIDYNNDIIINANEELLKLAYALEAVYHKYRIVHPTDSPLGEKWLASHFVLSVFEELTKASDELRKELEELMILCETKNSKLTKAKKAKRRKIIFWISMGCLTALATGACSFLVHSIR